MSKEKNGSPKLQEMERKPSAAAAGPAESDVPEVLTARSRWRVSRDELGDPLISLNRGRGMVYAIGPSTLGLWLQGKPGHWQRKLQDRFGFCDVRQRGDTEAVFAWPADDARTDEMLAFIGARKRRRLGAEGRARLIEAGSAHRYRVGHRPKTPSGHGVQRRTSRSRGGKRTKVGQGSWVGRS